MAYEPLTPYKTKDDPLWYVFDEDQNFKTFETRDKALKHIRATKYPLNEGIDLDTAYNSQNKNKVQNRNAKIDSFNVAEGYDVKPIEPIEPQKIEYATDETNKEKKEEPSWYVQLSSSFGKGLREVGKTLVGDAPRTVASTYLTAPEGFNLEPEEGWSEEHKKAIDIFNKEILAKGKVNDQEYINNVFKNAGLNRARVQDGRVLTDLTPEKQIKILEKSTTIQLTKDISEFFLKNPIGVDSWDDIEPNFINTLAQAIPNFAVQVGLSYVNPYAGMSYAGMLMGADTYTTAEPYMESGQVSPQEASRLSSIVGATSLVLNYFPSSLWARNPQFTQKVLFDKAFKKGLHKNITKETMVGGVTEMLQELGDEEVSMWAEETYRDIPEEEKKFRRTMAVSVGGVLGSGASGVLTNLNNKQTKKVIEQIVEQENMLLPLNMSINNEGDISFRVKEEDFNNKENYEYVKKIVNNKNFKKRLDPERLAKKYPNVPLNLAIFNELNNENPNTDDVDIEYNKKLMTSIMTDEDIRKANYDPDNPQWLTAELQEGEEGYEEGKRKFKVHTLGSNIYNSSGGSIVLSEGVSQDVFVEELTEVLYKKLATTNPKLKRRIDRWIKKTTKILDNNNIGGPRNIELFSKFYTFNYLGYADTEFDLGQIAKMPKGILKDFDAIMGEQKDGTNLSFLFKGKSKGDVITETETETDINESSQTVETPEESFRLTPQQEEFFKDSKVRDSGGNPNAEMLGLEKNYLLKVYHGTRNDFEEFKFLDSETTNKHYAGDLGFWFTSEPKYESSYEQGNAEFMASEWARNFKYNKFVKGANVIPAYLNLKNPIEVFGDDLWHTPLKQQLIDIIKIRYNKDVKSGKEIREALLLEGIDGVHIKESSTDGNVFRDDWVAFKPEQIKSQFNPKPTSDPRMSFSLKPNKEYKGDEVRDKIYSVLPDKDTEANLRKKLNRDPKVGSPKNKSKTLTNEKYRITVGNKTIDQWIKDVENNMTPEQIMEARPWYDNYIDDVKPLTELSDGSLDSSLKFVLGSLVTQQNESPEGSINNLLMAFEEESSGSKSSKKAGLNNDAVRQLFTKDGKIKSGVGQKLFDFIDSAIGNNTRYIMGNDPKGGSPYTADIHTSRGRGFIDQTFLDALERAFGKNKIKSLLADFGGRPTETQYENVSAFGNKLTKKLNDINWMGQEWTTQQVQAVDWVNVINFLGDYGIKAGGTMGDAILGNTQTVSSALVFGEGTPYSKKFSKIYDMDFEQQLKITSKVNPEIAKEASKLTGVKAKVEFNQQGFWKDNASEPTTTMTIISSKDGIQSFLDALGYLAQQTEVLGSRNNKTGKNAVLYFYDRNSKFKNLDKQKEFYNKLREIAPEEISGASSDYYMIEGKKIPAISIITDFKAPSKITIVQEKADFLLNKSNEFINLHKESLESLSDLDIDVTVVLGDKVKSSNDWKENSNGEDYIQRLSKRYGRGIQQRLENSSRRIESLLETEINQEKSNQEEKSYRLAPKDNLVVNPETTKEYLVRRVQDELYRLKVIQDKVGDIPEDQDAYLKAELFIGKASDRIENFRTKELEPLVKELTDDGFTIEDLGDYLYARHSKERNKLILERTDGDKKDGSGMSSKDANEILNKFKNTKIKDYAKKVDTIINKTLDVLYDGELITKEDYDYYKSNKMFKNYVPLKGKPDEDSFLGIGKGFSVSGKDVKRAKGRESRANNPFVQVLADYEQAVIRAEKNQVGISFYNLIKENPSDIWEAKGLKHIPRYDSDGELQYFDPTQLKQKEIEVKIKGKRKIITINDKVLLDSMKKMGGFRPPQFLVNFNKFFRAVNTTLSPEFIITNFERDLQAGLFNLSADYKGLTSKTFKNIFKAQKGIWDNIQGKETEWSNLYKEYKKNGGKVGWFDQMTIDEKVGKLEKMLKTYQSKNKLGISLRATGKFINDINEMVESGVRLSTYKSLIEAGVSPKKSAQYSKNLTVNFNKKGEIGTLLNTFWVFSNAGIQGTARLFKMAQTKRGKKIVGGLVAVGFIQSLLNRLIDEEDWEKFSDFNKDNYYLVLLPNGKALSLKAPYGFNVFKVAGSLMEEMIFGDTTFAEASKRMLKSVNDAFNPIGGSSPFQIMSPTIFEPYAQIIENKNFFGGPIMPEQPAYQPKEANSQRYFKSVRKPSKAITTWLNKVTGGTEEISGLVDVSPEVVDHLIDTYTGSTGKFVGNLIDTGTSLAKDGQLPATNNIPIVRQFIKEESEYVSSKVVYYMINESKRTKFSPEQRKRFKRHISYMKEGQYNEEKYKTKSEWTKYLNKLKREFSKNQRDIK